MILNCVSCSGSGSGQDFVSTTAEGGYQIKRYILLIIIFTLKMKRLLVEYYDFIPSQSYAYNMHPYLKIWDMRNDQMYELKLCASVGVWLGPGLHKQVASLAAARWWFAQFVHRQCFSNLPESTEPAQSLHNLSKSSQKGCPGDRWIKMDIQWPVSGLLLWNLSQPI